MKKKILISLAVVMVFIGYSVEIRQERPKLTAPTTQTSGSPSKNSTNTNMKNGTFVGSVENAYYGDVQVKATVTNGKISAVSFLKSPDTHSTSVFINNQAMPLLEQEAIQSQTANVDIISGATYTSEAFIKSLDNALRQAV